MILSWIFQISGTSSMCTNMIYNVLIFSGTRDSFSNDNTSHAIMQGIHLNPLLATSGVMEGRRATLLCEREYRRAERRGVTRYRCPCRVCKGGGRPMNRATIQQHIESRGRDPTLTNNVLVRQSNHVPKFSINQFLGGAMHVIFT